jgi:hypothetical protein
MTTRRQWESNADNVNTRPRGAKMAGLSRAVRRYQCQGNRVFIPIAKARTCSRETSCSDNNNLAHLQRDDGNRSYAKISPSLYVGKAWELALDWWKQLKEGRAKARLAPVEIG